MTTSEEVTALIDGPALYIGGQWVHASDGGVRD